MKTRVGPFALPLLALLVLVASTVNGLAAPTEQTNAPVRTGGDKVKEKVRNAVADGKDAVREGVHKADELVTNAVHHIGVGAHKATGVATNVAAKVKVAVTNAVGQVSEAIRDATR